VSKNTSGRRRETKEFGLPIEPMMGRSFVGITHRKILAIRELTSIADV
jgi:hypothetical protein